MLGIYLSAAASQEQVTELQHRLLTSTTAEHAAQEEAERLRSETERVMVRLDTSLRLSQCLDRPDMVCSWCLPSEQAVEHRQPTRRQL